MLIKTSSPLAVAAAVALAMPVPGLAQDFANLDDMAKLTVLPGWRTEQGTYMAGLQIALAPGWKTYWRAPGDAGIPPRFTWAGSENVAEVTFHWPSPKMFFQNGTRSIGYQDTIVIPMEVTPSQAQPVTLRGQAEIGVCDEVCLPLTVDFTETLDGVGAHDPAIGASLNNQPVSAREGGVTRVECTAVAISDGMQLTATVYLASIEPTDFAVVELAQPGVWISSAIMQHGTDSLTATSDLVPANAKPFDLELSDVRITLLRGDNAVDIQGCTG